MTFTRPARPRLSVDAICRKYHNEEVHTRQVARLALRLFDATRRRLQLAAADRSLLEAAARLHDVGYSTDPRGHRQKSADIVRREGLEEFDDADRAVVAAVMLFHSGDFEATGGLPQVAALPDPGRARRLGALLRVADGLDYGHLQDAVIVRVRSGPGQLRVSVGSPWFPQNLGRADEKADLWRATFPVDVEFVAVAVRKPGARLAGPGLSALEAARRLIMQQYKVATSNVAGALRPEETEPLHDLRVALRRLRAVLRMFRGPLAHSSAARLDRRLRQLNRALGPARDLEVWLAFLNRVGQRQALARDRGWAAYVQHELEARWREQATVRRCLQDPALAALRLGVGRLARVEIPRLESADSDGGLETLARRALAKNLRRALKLSRLRHSVEPAELHRLRMELRRARYAGEFFAPVLGPPFGKLTRHIHATEQALARIHDADVGLGRARQARPAAPRWLVQRLEQRRRQSWARLQEEWDRLERLAARRDVRHALRGRGNAE